EAEPTADGRTAHPKPDRNSTACPVQGCHARVATDQDHVWRERDQFRRRFANAFSISGAPAILEPYIAAISPTQFLQALQECSDAGKRFRIVRCPRQEQPDAAHPFTLLRGRRKRPRGCSATDERYELAAFHPSVSRAPT